ncbi:MAG: hypothetical protein B7Y80_17190 [Hyphomicrobium sp. 32-62-53]|nr:MAG: hypothetical protein B7Z29_08290 [Hyphomicrobium sp. 12-62-95]OYX98106.1 MAG: hypothetical protein B7Y80_17190 [Hyphomicrobium sp. 32-62-53]
MKRVSIDIAAELVRLEGLTNFELRSEWRRLHHMQPPKSLSRDLLLRGITYKIQERASGGLSKSVLRRLTGAGPDATSNEHRRAAPLTVVKPGTRLVREWNGETHTVLVHADGVEWRDRRYRSLSVVAREITGAHWSGPRFFGLTSRKDPTDG